MDALDEQAVEHVEIPQPQSTGGIVAWRVVRVILKATAQSVVVVGLTVVLGKALSSY